MCPLKSTHWAVYVNESYFDSFGCPPPKLLTYQTNKKN